MVIDAAGTESATSPALHHIGLLTGAAPGIGVLPAPTRTVRIETTATGLLRQLGAAGPARRFDPARAWTRTIGAHQGGASLSRIAQVLIGRGRGAQAGVLALVRIVASVDLDVASDTKRSGNTAMGRVLVGRPVSLSARLAGKIIDFESIAREVERDGHISTETVRVIEAGRAMARDAGPITETIEVVCSALSGASGIRSPRFLRRINEMRRANVVDLYPDFEPEPTSAARAA